MWTWHFLETFLQLAFTWTFIQFLMVSNGPWSLTFKCLLHFSKFLAVRCTYTQSRGPSMITPNVEAFRQFLQYWSIHRAIETYTRNIYSKWDSNVIIFRVNWNCDSLEIECQISLKPLKEPLFSLHLSMDYLNLKKYFCESCELTLFL